MPCNPSDLTINVSSGPSAALIPGFGKPFAPTLPSFTLPFPGGFPEDLLGIYNALQFILPPGTIKPSLNLNYSKDIFDAIMSLMDKFFPFLMLYKFFMPVLDLIICIIEVLCALLNPFKLPGAISRLFTQCLPAFLALFPIFALIVMILSLLNLIISIVEYLLNEILKLIKILLKNIQTITNALVKADQVTVLAAINKIGMILCSFQSLFVILALFDIIIGAIKDMMKIISSIPPCDNNNNSGFQCCTPDVCPSFIKNDDGLVRATGTLQYYNAVNQDAGYLFPGVTLPFPLTNSARPESWQFYDTGAAIPDAFWNITSAYDLPAGVEQIFFPTDANYTDATPPKQVAYTVDLRLFYNPSTWGIVDSKGPRYVRVSECIVLKAPTQDLTLYNNTDTTITNGVLEITGGTVTEDDGLTEVFINGVNATLNNLIHLPPTTFSGTASGPDPVVFNPTDGYAFDNVTYTFHINYPVLLQKGLITVGCLPEVNLNKTFINNIYGGNVGLNFTLLNNLLNSGTFPDTAAAQQCLTTALTNLQNNVSAQAVADFQAMTTVCLNTLGDNAITSMNTLVGIGFDPYKSTFTITPIVQFTTQSILISVSLNENSGQSMTTNLPASISQGIAERITAISTFGDVSLFSYDGYQQFTGQITSPAAGAGTIQIKFDNKIISVVNIPSDTTVTPTVTPLTLDYTFIYSPSALGGQSGSVGTDGSPRRDEGDVARDGSEG